MTSDAHAQAAAIMDQWVADYADDPERFVREVFAVDPDPWQRDVLAAYRRAILPGATARDKRISIRSGHGPGKTATLAWIAIHFMCFRFRQKTACTAPTQKQMFDALYAEIKIWLGQFPAPLRDEKTGLFEVKSDTITLRASPAESFLTAQTASADKPEALAGKHSDWVLLMVDEASGVPEAIFEAASGSMSGHNAITILAGNPVRTVGLFYDTHHKLAPYWTTFHVRSQDSPRVSPEYVEDMARRYGSESNAFRVRVLGEFPRADDDTIIPREAIEAAALRDITEAPTTATVWGVSPGWRGRAVLAQRRGRVMPAPPQWRSGLEPGQIIGWVKAEWDSTPVSQRPTEVFVDALGHGADIAATLFTMGLPARALNVNELPALSGHPNLRTELYFKAKAWFLARNCQLPPVPAKVDDVMLDFVEELAAQAHNPPTSGGKVAATAPKDMAKRLGRYPALADAFILTFASQAGAALFGPTGRREPLRRNIRGIV